MNIYDRIAKAAYDRCWIDIDDIPSFAESIQDDLDNLADINIDIDELEANVAKVYCHITNGRISQINTDADTVIAVADDCLTEIIDCETRTLKSLLADRDQLIATLIAIDEGDYQPLREVIEEFRAAGADEVNLL